MSFSVTAKKQTELRPAGPERKADKSQNRSFTQTAAATFRFRNDIYKSFKGFYHSNRQNNESSLNADHATFKLEQLLKTKQKNFLTE